jgi:hypothetical protein
MAAILALFFGPVKQTSPTKSTEIHQAPREPLTDRAIEAFADSSAATIQHRLATNGDVLPQGQGVDEVDPVPCRHRLYG